MPLLLSTVWEVPLSREVTGREALKCLTSEGFEVGPAREQPVGEAVYITAQERVRSPWSFLIGLSPVKIHCSLESRAPRLTRLTLTSSAAPALRVYRTIVLIALLTLLATSYRSHPSVGNASLILTARAAYMLLLAAASTLIAGNSFLPSTRFSEKLEGLLTDVTGHPPNASKRQLLTHDSLPVATILAVWLLFFVFPLLDAGTAFFLLATVFVFSCLFVCAYLSFSASDPAENDRTVVMFPASVFAAVVAFSGLTPLWLPNLIGQPGNDSPTGVLFRVVLLLVIPLVALATILPPQLKYISLRIVSTIDRLRRVHDHHPVPLRHPLAPRLAWVVGLWAVFSVTNLTALVLALSVVENALFGQNRVFPVESVPRFCHLVTLVIQNAPLNTTFHASAGLIARGLLISYGLPILLVFAFLASASLRRTLADVSSLCSKRSNQKQPHPKIEARLQDMAQAVGIVPPRLQIVPSPLINASVRVPAIPGFRLVLCVTTASAQNLPPQQMEALLAHEIGHVRNGHIRMFAILSFLSRWTFLGETFLLALPPSRDYEREADEFAIQWLKDQYGSDAATDLLHALVQNMEKAAIVSAMGHIRETAQSLPMGRAEWLPDDLRSLVANHTHSPFWRNVLTGIRLFGFLFAYGCTASYVHMPFHERIQAIQSRGSE